MLAGWRLVLSVGLAGVRAAGRRGHQGGGGVRLEGAARAGDRAGGPLLIGQADTTQAGQIGQVVTVGGGSFPVLIGAAAVLIGAGSGQKKSQGGRRRPFTLAFSFLLLIEAGRVLPGADRGRGHRALVPAAPDPPARGTGHGSRWHRSAGAILPFAEGVRFFT